MNEQSDRVDAENNRRAVRNGCLDMRTELGERVVVETRFSYRQIFRTFSEGLCNFYFHFSRADPPVQSLPLELVIRLRVAGHIRQ